MNLNRKAARKAENLDILIGFLGFFAALLVVVIVASELGGRNAAGWSITLLAIVVLMWRLIRARRRSGARRDGSAG